jgi:iron(III) transport system substrate-binding protein
VSAASRPSRRQVMLGAALSTGWLGLRHAAAEQPSADLITAANREGTVIFYTAVDLPVSQKVALTFMQRYPGIKVKIERTGAERVTQRIMQEYASNIKVVDVVDSSDTPAFLDWKDRGWIARYLPEDVVSRWPENERDADHCFATFRAHISVMGYNTRQVSSVDAPKSYADLLDARWRARLVIPHPAFSGSALLTIFALVKALGWTYFEQLARQRVMQVQAAVTAAKQIALGERSVMIDGPEYAAFFRKENGDPIEIIYATEGSTLVPAQVCIMQAAPHPNAARLFTSFLFSLECQQLISDEFGLRSLHPDVKPKAGRMPISSIRLLHVDPIELQKEMDDIKQRYSKIFGV